MNANYYDVCVNAARMINKPKATRTEIEKIARKMFEYTGKNLDKLAFDVAFAEFRKASGGRIFITAKI